MSQEKTIDNTLSIWELIGDDFKPGVSSPTNSTSKKEDGKTNTTKLRRIVLVGNFIAIPIWLYAITQTFIFNVDQYVKTVTPSIVHEIVDYKILFFVLLTFITVISFKKYAFVILYVFFYPIILIFWKIPVIIYKFKSWLLALSVMEIITDLISNFKQKVIIFTLSITALVLATTTADLLLYTSIGASMIAITWMVFGNLKSSLSRGGFLSRQTKVISFINNSKFIKDMTLIDAAVKSSKVELTTEQKGQVLVRAQMAVGFHRLLLFWAYQLEKYSSSKVGSLLNWFRFALLVATVSILLTVINFSLYKVDHSLFEVEVSDSAIAFLYYSITSLYFAEVNSIQAGSTLALAVKLGSGIIGVGILGSLIVNLWNSKDQRDQENIKRAVKDIRQAGSDFEKSIQSEYTVESIDQLLEKLLRIGVSFSGILVKLTDQIPKDYRK